MTTEINELNRAVGELQGRMGAQEAQTGNLAVTIANLTNEVHQLKASMAKIVAIASLATTILGPLLTYFLGKMF